MSAWKTGVTWLRLENSISIDALIAMVCDAFVRDNHRGNWSSVRGISVVFLTTTWESRTLKIKGLITIDWHLKKSISQSSGGWQVHNQGSGRFKAW